MYDTVSMRLSDIKALSRKHKAILRRELRDLKTTDLVAVMATYHQNRVVDLYIPDPIDYDEFISGGYIEIYHEVGVLMGYCYD